MRRVAVIGAVLVACSSSEPPATDGPGTSSTVTTSDAAAPAASDATVPDAGSDASTVPACPSAGPIETGGALDAAEIDEASGIVASALNPGIFWVHNDSGDSARAFAIDQKGARKLTLAFDTAAAVDIEDIAVEDAADGSSYLYFADIGDNAAARASLVIHRVREPKLAAATTSLTVTSEKMTVKYGDAPHDAETLLFDPLTRELFIATKVVLGSSSIHRVGPFAAGTTATTSRIAGVPVTLATAGEISRDGSRIAIRNYTTSASLWTRAPGESLAAALARTPCKIPIATERQGEAFAFLPDGSGYVTLSEGASSALHFGRF